MEKPVLKPKNDFEKEYWDNEFNKDKIIILRNILAIALILIFITILKVTI